MIALEKKINKDDRLRRKMYYHSFKLFPCFWLVKTTRIIHHNQVLLEFGTNFVRLNRWRQNDVKSAAWLQVIEPLTIKTWGQGWVVLVVRTKWRNITLFSAKYCPKTWYEQHEDGRHLLFGVYLQTWTDLYLLNFPIKMHYISVWTYIDHG